MRPFKLITSARRSLSPVSSEANRFYITISGSRECTHTHSAPRRRWCNGARAIPRCVLSALRAGEYKAKPAARWHAYLAPEGRGTDTSQCLESLARWRLFFEAAGELSIERVCVCRLTKIKDKEIRMYKSAFYFSGGETRACAWDCYTPERAFSHARTYKSGQLTTTSLVIQWSRRIYRRQKVSRSPSHRYLRGPRNANKREKSARAVSSVRRYSNNIHTRSANDRVRKIVGAVTEKKKVNDSRAKVRRRGGEPLENERACQLRAVVAERRLSFT